MSTELRKEVLRCYKHLLRTLYQKFSQDEQAIVLTRQTARQEFRKNIHLNDPEEIKQCVQIAYDSASIIKRTVIQARLNDRGNYEATIQKENIDGPP